MCGIIGAVNFKFDVESANLHLGHRGPDERNTIDVNNVRLHHLRLTILDAEGGMQPMTLDERYHIIFNGEIYNHLDVRAILGLQCRTRSDTETILHAYRKVGEECLQYFDGMFAIAIYDSVQRQLFIARDRAGEKPLYWFTDGCRMIFGSEQKVLQKMLALPINSVSINDYLQRGLIGRMTPYVGMNELTAGTYMTMSTESLEGSEVRWWNINKHYSSVSRDSYLEAKEKVNSHLQEAVRRRVESSDLEVGTFLSGGIDSGLVTAMAAQLKPDLKAFTISFDGVFDESDLARAVAQKYDLAHEVIPISFDHLKDDFEKIVLNYGEPFSDSSAIPSYYVSQEAKKHLTVILNGDGADELFGGYRRYVPYAKYDFYRKGKVVTQLSKLLKLILPLPHNKKSKYNYMYRLCDILTKTQEEVYWSSTSDTFSGFFEQFHSKPRAYETDIFRLLESTTSLTGLQKQMNLDFEVILAGSLLKKMDIATMANSLEGRSPFLSKELLEYVPSIDDSYKVKGARTKHVLRDLAEIYLPPVLVNQPKRGFEIPLKKWIDNDLEGFVDTYLNRKDRFVDGFISGEFIDRLIERKVKVSNEKRAKMIYKLLVTEIWSNSLS